MASATKAPPGAMMTPVPVALARSGRKAVNVGVTTLKITVPRGVFSTDRPFLVHFSEPGATPGQTFTTCEPAEPEQDIRNTKAIAVHTALGVERITTFLQVRQSITAAMKAVGMQLGPGSFRDEPTAAQG